MVVKLFPTMARGIDRNSTPKTAAALATNLPMVELGDTSPYLRYNAREGEIRYNACIRVSVFIQTHPTVVIVTIINQTAVGIDSKSPLHWLLSSSVESVLKSMRNVKQEITCSCASMVQASVQRLLAARRRPLLSPEHSSPSSKFSR